MSDVVHQTVIHTNEDKGYQIRLVYNEFKDREYVHIRKYFLSYEGEYVPSKEGISIPASLESVKQLLAGMLELCSSEEGKQLVKEILDAKH